MISTTLALPTVAKKDSFKAKLRSYKPKFVSPILSARFDEVSPIVNSYASGITSTSDVDVALFDNSETIIVGVGSTHVSGNNLIYLPGLESDFVNLKVGSSSTTITFTSTAISIGGTNYNLNDGFTLGDKFFTIKGLGGALLQSGNIPSYSVTPSATTVSEGNSVSFTVNTTDVGAGTTLYFSTGGASVDTADFSDGSLTGSFNIVSTGSTTGVATFTRSIATDFLTESSESFTIQIRTNSTSGSIVATSSTIDITDVVPTFSAAVSSTTVDEGGSITFTISGTNIPDGTYHRTIEGVSGTISSSDFSSNINDTFTISNNSGSFTITLADDLQTEGEEKFKVRIRRDSATGTIVATSSDITINDTSRAVGSNANGLTFGPVQVNRDSGVAANASDWYTICGLDNVPDNSSIALFIDTSGSMTQATVQASYDLLLSKLNARGITITSVTNPNEDWITPFLVNLP